MACPITVAKFVGTVSLGLLTGLSYSISTIALPALQALPTATSAANTLRDIQCRTRRSVLTLSNLAAICLMTSFTLSSPRRKHPYLIWTSLLSLVGGGFLEWWTNHKLLIQEGDSTTGGASFLSSLCCRSSSARTQSTCCNVGSWVRNHIGLGDGSNHERNFDDEESNGNTSEIEIVEQAEAESASAAVPGEELPAEPKEGSDINGESVGVKMERERRFQKLRTWILGAGFSMGVVGIWGDGA